MKNWKKNEWWNILTPYINWLKDRNRSLNTIQVYTETLKKFPYLETITTEIIRTFLKENITHYQPNTLKIFRQSLSSYAKFHRIEIEWERTNEAYFCFEKTVKEGWDQFKNNWAKIQSIEFEHEETEKGNKVISILTHDQSLDIFV